MIECVKQWAEETEKESPEPLTFNELQQDIKSMKKGKSRGPDDIPNEAFIEADTNTRHIYLRVFNQIIQNKQIPQE